MAVALLSALGCSGGAEDTPPTGGAAASTGGAGGSATAGAGGVGAGAGGLSGGGSAGVSGTGGMAGGSGGSSSGGMTAGGVGGGSGVGGSGGGGSGMAGDAGASTGGAAGSGGSAGAAGSGGAPGGAGGSAGAASGGVAGSGGSGAASERCNGAPGAYYVDSAAGNDAGDGRSTSTAWKSLAKVNATTFMPGESLCFKAGSAFTGELHPLGSGSDGMPIVIDHYGDGARPKITAGASDANAVSLVNQRYWEINGLEVTNPKAALADARGISIRGSNAGTLQHIYVRDCFIHDVSGQVNWIGGDVADNEPGVTFQTGWDASKRTGGIVVEVDASMGTAMKTKFDDVRIEDNVIQDVSFGSIITKQLDGSVHWGIRSSRNDANFTPHTNVVIRGNYLSQTNTDYGCNAIYMTGVQDGLIESNVVKDAGTSAIEVYNTDRVTIQKNETFGTKRKANGADFNGIDTDKATTGTIIQYNYVHDNGDGILLCQFSFGDSIVRYNLIVNNSRYGVNLHSDSAATNATYNNVFFAEGLNSASLVSTSGDGSHLAATYAISNNILHTTRSNDTARTGSGVTYRNNLYSGLPAVAGDSGAKTGSPAFVNVGMRMSGGTSGPAWASLVGFKVGASSPARNAGVSIASNGGVDFFGAMLYAGMPDIGIAEEP